MLSKGAAKKVVIHLNEDTRGRHGLLYHSILDFLLHKRVAGATLFRPHAGFGSHHKMHSFDSEAAAEHLPLRIEFIESAMRVEELLPSLYEMLTDGLIEVQDTAIVKAAAQDAPQPERYVRRREQKPARLMRIFLGEADQRGGEPLYDAIVKRLRMMEVSGATVYRGILGYGAKGHTHKESFLHLSRDLPVMISVIDTAEKIEEAAVVVEQMMDDGLIVLSDVEMIRLVHDHPNEEPADAVL